MRKIFYLLALAALLINACTSENRITVKGKINGEKQRKSIFLNRIEVDYPVFIDSSEIGRNGNFRFRIESPFPEFYQLGFSSSNFITILASPGEKIDLVFNDSILWKDYSVTGSEGSADIKMLDERLARTRKQLDSVELAYIDASERSSFEDERISLEKTYEDLIKNQRKNNIDFIVSNPGSFASIKALYQELDNETGVLYETRDLQYFKIVADTLGRYYPRSKNVIALKQDVERGMNRFSLGKIIELADTIREVNLDPVLTDIDGNRIALSSLRGKYVLLSFWSATSAESVAENRQLKEYYRQYKNRGFEIYQVNLDADENAWRTAVRFEELPWISTREDDPRNPVTARLFNVQQLPANYLYDKNGDIVAKDLHGRSLMIKLNQLFPN
ncbi:MAG: TlpA disulfide reductase family protein [Bacteroidales bacterium]|jgi:hypothetical protein|nr:TlpA disulfide reductase family protein [Bacteroidales bacterium]